MKNLKKKIGISLAALAFFATAGLASKSATGIVWNTPDDKDLNVVKVVETLKKTKHKSGYTTSNKRQIVFIHEGGTIEGPVDYTYRTTEFLELKIYKLDKDGAIPDQYVTIKDYNLDNLNSQDIIGYVIKNNSIYMGSWETVDTIKFGELSSKAQQEIRKEYNKIIKEAPEKLLKEDEEYKQYLKQQEEQKNYKLEKDILSIIK